MVGCFGNSAEDRARERELNQYLDKQDAEENRQIAIDELIAANTAEVLNDEAAFRTLDDDYEVIDRGQVMRALRSLDAAIKDLNHLAVVLPRSVNIDPVFTALSNIQNNFKAAIEHKSEKEYNGRIE